ncbi:hypothetical protein PMG11_10386 [Penicillium brasilianum]|uniref:Uncharacterized protein n=1 Tax=Penicillium brasilianum TaxID=104259 RepID=A0A0F7U2G1_PENBI|nr:hypothetical protein PMG11_10386 [Penicillium brasilianum]
MGQRAALNNVSQEVLENILIFLSLGDLKSLRFVSRRTSLSVARKCFMRHTTTLTSSGLSSTEALMRNDMLGRLVRHIRVIAECFAVDSAQHTLESGEYYPGEVVVTNDHCDTFTVQISYPKKKGTNEQLAHTLNCLRWMQKHAAAKKISETTTLNSGSEESFVDRLAAIFALGAGFLTTLELDARFIEGPNRYSKPVSDHIVDSDRRQLWADASRVYRLTMTALARSGVAIPDLRIYCNTTGCSVPSYDVTVGLPTLLHAGLANSCANVKTLALSFSTRVDHGLEGLGMVYGAHVATREKRKQRRHWDQNQDEVEWFQADGVAEFADSAPVDFDVDGSDYDSDEETDAIIRDAKGSEILGRYGDNTPEALCQDNFPGISQLLVHMINLESLDLHMFQTLEYEAYDGGSRLFFYARVFQAIVDQGLMFCHLRHLALRGLCINASDLVSFLERHGQIENLELHHVMRSDSLPGLQSWKEVLKEICRRTILGQAGGSLARVFCSDLGVVPRTARGLSYDRPESLLGDNEELKQEWIDRWWCGPSSVSAGPLLHTRELPRDELARADLFGGVGAGNHGRINIDRPMPTNYPTNELRVLREERYGTTYG